MPSLLNASLWVRKEMVGSNFVSSCIPAVAFRCHLQPHYLIICPAIMNSLVSNEIAIGNNSQQASGITHQHNIIRLYLKLSCNNPFTTFTSLILKMLTFTMITLGRRSSFESGTEFSQLTFSLNWFNIP